MPFENKNMLFDAFKQGNEEAFELVFEYHYFLVFYFTIRSGIKDPAEASDITLDAFTKLFNLHANFENLKGIKAFLYVTARNGSLDYLRFVNRRNSALSVLGIDRD